ncbi:hypothetical protein [Secundilactobacillus kimchicus]|uniref:hypothetical protein n=1 Tax=Secundilactobacillus kimchicus TaxID=528209 RepID=UPI00243642BC|nr:hypothetical protein [Secundilactobacillus kimchicus]
MVKQTRDTIDVQIPLRRGSRHLEIQPHKPQLAVRHVASSILNFMLIWLNEHPDMSAASAATLMMRFINVPTTQLLQRD